jgi:hypothetical protein
VKRIPLSGGKAFALVDDADYEFLRPRPWHLVPAGSHRYARSGRPGCWIYMHRLLLNAPKGKQVDHINRDGLDNRRSNLRLCNHSENGQNTVANRGAGSRFRGVYFHKSSGQWMARHTVEGHHYFIGRFKDEVEAARAAQAFRDEHMPFAQPDPELLALDHLEAYAA